jgi:predicted PurR-regulated permease PerM
MTDDRADLGRTLFAVFFVVGLIAATLWILRPFLGPLLWAVMIVVATWPLLLRLQGWLLGRRSLAVAVMTLALLLVLVLPVTTAIGVVVTHADTLVNWAASLADLHLPPPPDWLARVPVVGGKFTDAWLQFNDLSNRELLDRAAPYAKDIAEWLLPRVGSFGFVLVQFLVTVIVAAIIFVKGEEAGQFIEAFARRVAGGKGEAAVRLAAQAIRGVALGVVGTALIQAALAGIGLAIAGVPLVGLLTAMAFLLTVAQLGVLFVLAPAVAWLYFEGLTGTATFLLVWTVIVSTVDNFIRPLLIKRGADLSLLLIFSGVVGGLFAFGIIGIFVGPVLLAVSWTLLRAWVGEAG